MATLIRMRELARVFTPQGASVSAYIASLSVLYEDLRIELWGLWEETLVGLDATDDQYRIYYFLRRSIATLVEFAESLRLLDECPDFCEVKSSFGAEPLKRWNQALRFFRKHEQLLERVRNDIGGHFGQQAARFAVKNIDPSLVGKVELRDIGTGGRGVHLHFAGEIAHAATMRHLVGSTPERKFAAEDSELFSRQKPLEAFTSRSMRSLALTAKNPEISIRRHAE